MTTLTEQVRGEFERFTARYTGRRLKATFDTETVPLIGMLAIPGLESSIFTESVSEIGMSIDESRRVGFETPETGVFFRAEIYQRPGNPDLYLGAIFESVPDKISFKVHLETNDPEYADSHPSYNWE